MAGRPTEYTEDLYNKAVEYIEGGYEEEGHAIPSIVGMAKVLGRGKSTLYDWASSPDHPFSDILERCMEAQELTLFSKGLTNDFNATIVKLALGKHGYHDKADTTLSGPNGKPVQTDSIFEFVPVGSNADKE